MNNKENDAVRKDGVDENHEENEKARFEDDGRTVADMSGVEGRASFLGAIAGLRGERRRRREVTDRVASEKENSGVDMTRDEKRWFITGALGAALLIALAFGLGLGLIILLMVIFWK